MSTLWIVNQYASTPAQAGLTRHYDFASELIKHGHRVILIVASFDHKMLAYRQNNELLIEQLLPNLTMVQIRTSPSYRENGIRRFLNMAAFPGAVRKRYNELCAIYGIPDVVFGSSPHPFNWVAASHLAKKSGAQFCLEFRDIWPQTFIDLNGFSKWHPLVLFFRQMERIYYKKTNVIISPLPLGKEYMLDSFPEQAEKVTIIPQTIRCNEYAQNALRSIDPEIAEWMDKGMTCLYTGAFSHYAGIPIYLEAAKCLMERGYEKIQIMLVGGGADFELACMFAKENNLPNLRVMKSVSKADCAALQTNASILIGSTLTAGNGIYKYGISANKLTEYCYSGNPVIFLTDAKSAIVDQCGCGRLVPPENPGALVDVLVEMYALSSEERSNIGMRGREYINENHDLSVLSQKFENALRLNRFTEERKNL